MIRFAVVGAFLVTMAFGASQRLVEGNPGSSVRVIIYEDLQCPDCADFRKILDEKLLPKYQSKVAFEHRDFPLAKHAWARPAAIASRFIAEEKPALASDFRRYLMGRQPEINADNFPSVFERYARDHGIDPAKALASLHDAELAASVQSDFEEGVARGVAHTPTVLVNGTPFVEHFTYEEVAKAIDSELAANK
jgi:protein-disulfide isomerase